MDFLLDKLKKYYQLWIPISLGITAFIFVTGGKILWPSNINWLFLNPDVSNVLCAWQFYRHTPVFENPLGANYLYGMGMGGSVIFAEPLFLFAFPFKLFSNLLPTPFQYQGIWILLCFMLQAIFSWKILEKATYNIWLKLLGSIFFVLAPTFLWRLHGSPSFLGQWLILAGIFLYLSTPYHKWGWLILLCISSLVHPYFLLMLLALWSADLIMRKFFICELTSEEIIKYVFLTGIILLIIMWQAGYFMLQGGLEAGRLGLFRMNLLSFIDPTDGFFNSWSYVLKKQPRTWGDYEGFSYLGLGMIILGLIGVFKLIELRKFKLIFSKKMLPLICITVLLMIFALSDHIVLGHYELFNYHLPKIFNMFRASGRFALPIYYLIYLGILYVIIRHYHILTAIIFISICLSLQIFDSSNIYSKFRNSFLHTQPYISNLKAPVWKIAAKKYKKIIYVLPENNSENLDLIYYAAFNKLNINMGYFARIDPIKTQKARIKLSYNLRNGYLDKDALYIIDDKNLLRNIPHTRFNLSYKVMIVDGYSLLLPNWENSSTDAERVDWLKNSLYPLGTPIFFHTSEDNFKKYLILKEGWSTPEGNGTWTDGQFATILVPLAEKNKSNLILKIDAMPYINLKHPNLEVDIAINHQILKKVIYTIKNSSIINQIEIPSSLTNRNNLLEIQFYFKNAISPAELDMSTDKRKLGLLFSSLMISSKN